MVEEIVRVFVAAASLLATTYLVLVSIAGFRGRKNHGADGTLNVAVFSGLGALSFLGVTLLALFLPI